MTLPDERTRAINYTREFLLELLDTKKTPRVPREVRRRALSLLRHYPAPYEMQRVADHDKTETFA